MYNCQTQLPDDIPLKQVRSFAPKLIRQLNFKHNKQYRRERKRLKFNHHTGTSRNKISSNAMSNISDIAKMLRSSSHTKPGDGSNINVSNKRTRVVDLSASKGRKNTYLQGFSGKTEILFVNGAKFTGRLLNGQMLQGFFEFTAGFKYEGGFMHGKFFGQGSLKFPDGKLISGDWNGEKIVGNGEIKYKTGEIYYGQIQNFKKNGFGYFFLKGGSKFIGHFKDGKIKGKGSYFIEDKLIAEGNWQQGQLVQSLPVDLITYCQSFMAPFTPFTPVVRIDETSIFHPQKVYNRQFAQFSVSSGQEKTSKVFKSLKAISQDDDSSLFKECRRCDG